MKINSKRDAEFFFNRMRNAPVGFNVNITQDLLQAFNTLQSRNVVVENSTVTLFVSKTPSPTDLSTIKSLQELGIRILSVVLGKDVDISKLKDLTPVVQVPDGNGDIEDVIKDVMDKSEGSLFYNVFFLLFFLKIVLVNSSVVEMFLVASKILFIAVFFI